MSNVAYPPSVGFGNTGIAVGLTGYNYIFAPPVGRLVLINPSAAETIYYGYNSLIEDATHVLGATNSTTKTYAEKYAELVSKELDVLTAAEALAIGIPLLPETQQIIEAPQDSIEGRRGILVLWARAFNIAGASTLLGGVIGL